MVEDLMSRLAAAGYTATVGEDIEGIIVEQNGDRVFLLFDDLAACDGCQLRIDPDDAGRRREIAETFAEAFAIALDVGEPGMGARFREEFAATPAARRGEMIGVI